MLGPDNTEKRIQWALESTSQAGSLGPTETSKALHLAGLMYVDARILTALALDLAAETAASAGQLATTASWYLMKAAERISAFD